MSLTLAGSENRSETGSGQPLQACFPLAVPRACQLEALNFIADSINQGYRDIVVEAPTGVGKSGIGAAVCYWAGQLDTLRRFSPERAGDRALATGGYYLVTQKLLQDQLERDFPVFRSVAGGSGTCLKSASEYYCPAFGTCGVGCKVPHSKDGTTKSCERRKDGSCSYAQAKAAYMSHNLAVTNYAYFLTERMYANQMPNRPVLVLDECHNVERTLLKFPEMVISEKWLERMEMRVKKAPEFANIQEYAQWLSLTYLPVVQERAANALENLTLAGDGASPVERRKLSELVSHSQRVAVAAADMLEDASNWVFWQEDVEREGYSAIAKPLNAAPYMHLLTEAAPIRVYMSAFPGLRSVFCRSLGLNRDHVAWCALPSDFPVENRPIVMALIGSMSRRNMDESLPPVLRTIEKILKKHGTQKGLIHCNSYALGEAIVRYFSGKPEGRRLRFPRNADDRETAFKQHAASTGASVLVSPSMTEGFDFKDDLARFQVLAKMPYPYLGDKQTAAKKEMDAEWYAMETIKQVIQMTGRVCRSESDSGVSYVLDADFMRLWEGHEKDFPGWWRDACVWPS